MIRRNDCDSLGTRIIYPTAVIGPDDFHGSLTGQAIRKMAKGCLPALVSGGFDWVDVRDVARAAIDAAEKGVDKDRFILSGHYRDMKQVASVIADHSGVPAPRFSSPVWLARLFAPLMGVWARLQGEAPLYTQGSLTALSANRNMSHARAAQQLNYQPRPFRESIRDALLFYEAQNHQNDR